MTWQGIHGHDAVVDRFRNSLRRRRLASTYLFVGPAGIGKRTFALRLAQSLLCSQSADERLEACGRCPECQQVRANSHPDLECVGLPDGKSFIPLETFIGSKERRMREGLCHRIAMKPRPGSRKIAIIDDADHLNREGANCLLKTLEEPPPRSLLILVGTSAQRQLSTIRSRAQIVRFQPLSEEDLTQLVLGLQIVRDEAESRQVVPLAGGSLQRAKQLANPEFWEFRGELLATMAQADWDGVQLARRLGQFVDDAGKDAPLRRTRMREVIDVMIDFYRQLMRLLCGMTTRADANTEHLIALAAESWRYDAETAADCLLRCQDALLQVDANANQATLLACWLDDLSCMTRHGLSGQVRSAP